MDGKGNINVNAPKNIDIKAGKNITISAGENITTTAGMSHSETAGLHHSSQAGGMMTQSAALDYSLIAANIMEMSRGIKKSKAKEINEISSEHISNSQGKTHVHAKDSVEKNSGEKSNFY